MKLEELKALAEKATPGPWVYYQGGTGKRSQPTVYTISDKYVALISNRQRRADRYAEAPTTAQFIAALYPERVLRMIACIEAAKAMRLNGDFGNDPPGDFDAALATLESDQ